MVLRGDLSISCLSLHVSGESAMHAGSHRANGVCPLQFKFEISAQKKNCIVGWLKTWMGVWSQGYKQCALMSLLRYVGGQSNSALLWQKEASDKSDISCKRAKCVCHFHWCHWNIMMSYLTYLLVGWVFMHKIWPEWRAHWVQYENINNEDLDGMSLDSFCQRRPELSCTHWVSIHNTFLRIPIASKRGSYERVTPYVYSL